MAAETATNQSPNPQQFDREELAAEEWRPVAGYRGKYEVSNLGRVRSLEHHRGRRSRPLLMKMRKHTSKHPYFNVMLWLDGKPRTILVHRLVCAAFHGPAPSPLHEVAHGDQCGTNNREPNLRWATHKENCGERLSPNHVCGERHRSAKLTETDVRDIRHQRNVLGIDVKRLSERYAVAEPTIRQIARRNAWKHVA